MYKTRLIAAALPLLAIGLTAPLAAQDATEPTFGPTPREVVSQARAEEWRLIAPADLMVMDLTPDAQGADRRVIVQLVPEPLSAGWTSNIRTLATSGWWDGTSVYRVVDNWVAQWGDGEDDEADAKPLPDTLLTVPESDYTAPLPTALGLQIEGLEAEVFSLALTQLEQMGEEDAAQIDTEQTIPAETAFHFNDPYADYVGFYKGFPIASDFERFWPTHCYASVGVARDLSPNTGTGAELYAVIGNAPRALDRNIAVVGRVIEGIEHLSTLPRGTGGAGVYEDDAQRVPIIRVRMASDMAPEVRPAFRYLDEGSDTFARYLAVLSNRNDAFYRVPAGGVSLCNASVPVERVPEE